MNPPASLQLRALSHLLTARLSRRVVFWVFASLLLIEAIILVPSVERRKQEMLKQMREISSGKISWVVASHPNADSEELLNHVEKLQHKPLMHPILGGTLYEPNGTRVGSFGEAPELDFATVMDSPSHSFEATDRYFESYDRYDVAWFLPHTDGSYVLVIRHDATSVRAEIQAFIVRIAGLVLIISVVITVTTFAVLGKTVITPILNLREDLIAAGEAVSRDQPSPVFQSATVKRPDELGDVIAAFNQMFKQISEALTERKQAEQSLAAANQEITQLNQRLRAENLRMSAELAVSRKLQQMLLPREHELNAITDLEIAGFMEPATEVGGDYYDVLSQKDRVKIGIGDVTGHGLESGMLMLMTQTAVRTLLNHQETDPVKFLNTLNRTIYDNVDRMNCDRSLTLSILDYQNRRIQLSGQHEEVIVVRRNGAIERIDTTDLGFPLGLEANITPFVAHTQIDLQPGDGVVLYTDGITEARNAANELYGLERLCTTVQQCWGRSAQDIQQAVIQNVYEFIGDQAIADDLTLLILKQK